MQNYTQQIVPQQANTTLPQGMQQQPYFAQQQTTTYPLQYTTPQYYYPQNFQPQQAGAPSSSGVNIVIYNPSVNPTAGSVANSTNTYYPQAMTYPQNYYTQQAQPQGQPPIQKPLAAAPLNKTEEKKPKEEETHKETIVQLTDEYIKTLENYLNNPNKTIREMGVKELMQRFKEHKSRKTDVALTNLLNKALMDPARTVRFIALGTLDSGWAEGDDLTKQILTKMQSSKNVYGEDAILASEVLLKNAGNKVEIDVPGPKPEKGKKETKKTESK